VERRRFVAPMALASASVCGQHIPCYHAQSLLLLHPKLLLFHAKLLLHAKFLLLLPCYHAQSSKSLLFAGEGIWRRYAKILLLQLQFHSYGCSRGCSRKLGCD